MLATTTGRKNGPSRPDCRPRQRAQLEPGGVGTARRACGWRTIPPCGPAEMATNSESVVGYFESLQLDPLKHGLPCLRYEKA